MAYRYRTVHYLEVGLIGAAVPLFALAPVGGWVSFSSTEPLHRFELLGLTSPFQGHHRLSFSYLGV